MNIIKYIFALLLFSLAGCMPAFAQEAAADSGTLIANDWLDMMVKVVGMIVMAVVGMVADKARKKAVKLGLEEELYDAGETAVTAVYHGSYKKLKEIAADKKITKEEAAELRAEAFGLMKEHLSGPALQLAKDKGAVYASKLFEIIITKFKKK